MSEPPIDLSSFLEGARDERAGATLPEHLSERLMKMAPGTGGESSLGEELPREYGPYLLEEVLSSETSGTLYRGYDKEQVLPVMVKVLSPTLAGEEATRSGFIQKAKAMMKLSDEALLPLLAVHEETPEPCFAMPFLEGETLELRLAWAKEMEIEDVIHLAKEVCQGLAVLHRVGLVHGNLKPANIFLERTEAGVRARVMDFGLSSLIVEEEAPEELSFKAPEQIEGKKPDDQSDLYALGSILFSALIGKPLFQGKTSEEVLQKVASSEAPPRLSELSYRVPIWLSSIVEDLLQKDPVLRPREALVVGRRLASRVSERDQAVKINGGVVMLTAVLLTIGMIVFWMFQLKSLERKRLLRLAHFDILAELESVESGEVLRIPKGIFFVPSLDIGDRNIVIEGSGRQTKLIFESSLEEAAIRTSGKLRISNIVLNQPTGSLVGGAPLIQSQGSFIELDRCRIEQRGNVSELGEVSGVSTLVATVPGCQTSIRSSEIYTLRSIVWRSQEGSSLTLEDSIVIAPSLVYWSDGEGSGRVKVMGSTCLSQIPLSCEVSGEGPSQLELSVKGSVIESLHAFLWFPQGEEDLLRKSLRYQGENSLLMWNRSLISTSPRPWTSIARSEEGLDGWQESDWHDCWGKEESGVEMIGALSGREAPFSDMILERMKASQFILPDEYSRLGAKLDEVGPHGEK